MKEESQQLKEIKAEFAQWRANRIGREAIPEYLWKKAASLLDNYSPTSISKHLGLDYSYLKRFYAESISQNQAFVQLSSSEMPQPLTQFPFSAPLCEDASINSINSDTFLEVSPREIFTTNPNTLNNLTSQPIEIQQVNSKMEQKIEQKVEQTCQLVFERKDGVKLSMSLPLDWTNLSLFCSSLLKG